MNAMRSRSERQRNELWTKINELRTEVGGWNVNLMRR